MPTQRVGKRLREIRKARGFRSVDQAAAAGTRMGVRVSPFTLGAVERGQRPPNAQLLAALARVYGLTDAEVEELRQLGEAPQAALATLEDLDQVRRELAAMRAHYDAQIDLLLRLVKR